MPYLEHRGARIWESYQRRLKSAPLLPWAGATIGSFAIGAQFLFLGLLTATSYRFSRGLGQAQRSVLALGLATRNAGAAIAPLLAAPDIDQRAIVMVALGVAQQIACGLAAAAWFARDAQPISA